MKLEGEAGTGGRAISSGPKSFHAGSIAIIRGEARAVCDTHGTLLEACISNVYYYYIRHDLRTCVVPLHLNICLGHVYVVFFYYYCCCFGVERRILARCTLNHYSMSYKNPVI